MTELELLANEVSRCPMIGPTKSRRKYSQQLRDKIYAASCKYSQKKVAKEVGFAQSLIGRWGPQKSTPAKTKKKICRPVVIQELPKLSDNYDLEKYPDRQKLTPALKLTSPSGVCLEINIYNEKEIASIIKTFIGGAR